jgi:hypothetical protein
VARIYFIEEREKRKDEHLIQALYLPAIRAATPPAPTIIYWLPSQRKKSSMKISPSIKT